MEAQDFDDPIIPVYNSRIFHHLKNWEKFEALGDHIYFPENHYIVTPGDKINYCYLVVEGRVISLTQTQEGDIYIHNVFTTGSLFLESNLLCEYEADVTFQTVAPTELVRIDYKALKSAMLTDDDIFQAVMESSTSKYYSAMDQIRETYEHDAGWKIYNIMLLLAEGVGKPFYDDWVMINMKLSQQALSSMLGINRVTVNRELKKLRDTGKILLVNNNYYCIHKPKNS